MSKTTSNTTTNKLVTCMTCRHAMLHRYGSNPILAACACKPQPFDARFPHQVEVASTLRHCHTYAVSDVEKTVELRQKKA